MSFRLRLVISFLLVVLASLAIFWIWTSRRLDAHLYQIAELDLDTRLQMILPLIRIEDPDLDALIDRLAAGASCRITVIDRTGKVMADSAYSGAGLVELDNHAGRREIMDALEFGRGSSLRYSTSTEEYLLYVARRLPDGSGLVRIAEKPESIENVSAGLKHRISLAGVLIALGGAVAVWLISRRMSTSLERLSEAADAISAGEFRAEIPVRSGDEFGALARRMEQLARRLEEQLTLLESERNHLNAVLDSLTEGVLVTDAQGYITGANPAFLKMFQLSSEPVGKLPLEVVRNVQVSDGVQRILGGGERWEAEVRSGRRVFLARFAPIGRKDSPAGTAVVFLDISELRRLQNTQRDFISNVSHELKTPLTSIQGYAETLRNENLAPIHQRFIEKIYRNAAQLSEMIGELFSLARLERGSSELQLEEVSFQELVAEVRSEFSEQLEHKQLTFESAAEPGLDRFRADRRYIGRVFRNLVENAVKYTDRGRITLRMQQVEDGFRFCVIDTGIGIPQEHLSRIFERFYRVDRDRSRRTGGTGIGLAIVKHIVQLHNGQVWVESRVNEGTVISFQLPGFSPATSASGPAA